MNDDSLFLKSDKRQSLGIRELAEASRGLFSYATIYGEIKAGRLAAIRTKRGEWRIPRESAEKWWANLERSKNSLKKLTMS